jgi:arylsulfatase A-like enzyme
MRKGLFYLFVIPNLLFLLAGCSQDATKSPNILLILIDDMGYNDLAINNQNPQIQTPNLDALAREGVRFTRHYASSVCSPSRAALLTGQYPARHGFYPVGRGISPQANTLPRTLSDAGYLSWHIGKWHVGEELPEAWPQAQGFQHWFGFLNRRHLENSQERSTSAYDDPWLVLDGDPAKQYTGHLNDILTDKTLEVINDASGEDRPWFMNLWYFAPHSPSIPARRFAQLYPEDQAGRYRALLHQLDHNIGRILDTLKAFGQYDNTLIIAVSDNGGTNRAIDNNFPFSGTKFTLDEGGVRTPFIMKWPGRVSGGQVISEPVAIFDLFPTILSIAGLPPVPARDGVDLSNLKVPERQLFWAFASQGREGFAVLSSGGRWRLQRRLPWIDDTVLIDTQANEGAGAFVEQAEIQEGLYQAYLNWHREVHRLKLQLHRSDSGSWALTGDDFQRTPGSGGYSFAIEFSDQFQGQLVSQEKTWSLRREAAGSIIADFQGIEIKGSPESGRACHSMLLSGDFSRGDIWGEVEPSVQLRLYLDGQEVAQVSAERALDQDYTGAPTIIGNARAPKHSWGEPVILNIAVEASPVWTAQSIDARLCDPKSQQI